MTIGFHRTTPRQAPLPSPITLERLRPTFRKVLADDREDQGFLTTSGVMEEVEHPSNVLRSHSNWNHRLGDLYAEMLEKDLDLAGLYRKLFDAVICLDRVIEPGDDSPLAAEAAELCRWALGRIGGFDDVLAHLLHAQFYGVAFTEVVWEQMPRGADWRGAVVPVDLVDRPMHRFAWKKADRSLHIRMPGGKFQPVAPGKVLCYRRGGKDNPWGRAEADSLYYPVELTLHGDVYYSLFIERWADPIPRVKYPWKPGGDTAGGEQRVLAEQIAQALQEGKGIALPEGLDAGFIETMRSGSVSYESFLDHYAKRKAVYVLAEPQTTGHSGETGAYKSFEVSKGFFVARVQLAARGLGAWIKDDLLTPITRLNLGPNVAVPRFRMDVSESADRDLRLRALELWEKFGLEVPRRDVYRALLAKEVRPGEEPFDWDAGKEPVPEPLRGDASDEEDDDQDPNPEPTDDQGEDDDQNLTDRRPTLDLSEDVDISRTEERLQALDDVANVLRPRLIAHFTAQQEAVADAWERGDLADGIEPLAEIFSGAAALELGEILLASIAHGAGLAMADLLADGLPARLWQVTVPQDRPVDLAYGNPSSVLDRILDLSDASDAAEEAGTWGSAIEWWADRLTLSPDVFFGLTDIARRWAFSLAGVQDLRLLREVHQLVGEALADGLDRTTFRARLAQLYASRGLSPTSDWHADLVLVNNLRSAHAWVRWQQTVGNPAAHGIVPYLRWVTIADDKVRDRDKHHHRVMHGKVFGIDHGIWLTWWYPAGHNCRCAVELVTRAEAQRLGYTGSEPTGSWPADPHDGTLRAQPDPGFNAGFAQPHVPIEDQLRNVAREMRDQAPGADAASSGPGTSPAGTLLNIARDLLRALGARRILRSLFGDDP